MSIGTHELEPDRLFEHVEPESARRERAGRVDAAAVRIQRSRGALDLALGEAIARLFASDGGLIKLGYAKHVDYARERIGVPPRTMYSWIQLAAAVAGKRLLRGAVLDGSVTPRKALAVAPLAVDGEEAHWVAVAARLPLKELACLVQVHGADPPAGYGDVESLILRMTPEQQQWLDEAIHMAQVQTGHSAPRWQCVEIICQEWLGAFGEWQPDWPEKDEQSKSARPMRSVAQQLRVIAEAHRPLDGRESPAELDARIQRILKGRRRFDLAFGVVLHQISRDYVPAALGYTTIDEYCRERLGISPRSFRQRVWLERQMCALPPLREALESGRLTYSKVLLVAKDSRPHDVEERIAEAADTTWQQTERESTREEQRQNRARGLRRLWGPNDAMRTIALAIASYQAVAEESGLGRVEAGEALAMIALHFINVWETHKERQPGPRRREVMNRNDGCCAVPGCSRPAQHAHHLDLRSHGGSDDPSNLVGLCMVHHLRGVHGEGLRVSGCAGERLEWVFGNGERWVTENGVDRQFDAEPRAGEEVQQRSDRSI